MATRTLKEHRARAVLSTRELAAKAGVAAKTVWRIESGEFKRLHPRVMRSIADALGVDVFAIEEFARGLAGSSDEGSA